MVVVFFNIPVESWLWNLSSVGRKRFLMGGCFWRQLRDQRVDGRHCVQNPVSSVCVIPSNTTNYKNYTISSRCSLMMASNLPFSVDVVRCVCLCACVCVLELGCGFICTVSFTVCLSHLSLCWLPLQAMCSVQGFSHSFVRLCINSVWTVCAFF